MPTLNITVRNKVAVGDKQVIVCDNTDYLVHFDLDSEWQAFPVKTMRVLYADGTYEETIFTGSDCSLPRIYQAQSIKIGIYAGDLHSTVAATFACKESIIVEGEQHVQPPEDVYLQILNLIESGAVRGIGIASIEKTGTSGNVDTYTITYDDGTTTTFEVTNGAVTSVDGLTGDVVLDHKANIDGSYDGMTVGSAQQLLASSGVEDKVPYAYRTSGGSMDIGDREELNEINGMTVAWNQLVNPSTPTSGTNAGITRTNNGDGSWTHTGTATAAYQQAIVSNITPNRVYLYGGGAVGGSASTYYFGLQMSGVYKSRLFDDGFTVYKVGADETAVALRLRISSGITVSNLTIKPQLIDLTAMFGATIADYVYSLEQAQAGAGVAWFRDLFPNSYYAYSAPTLISVKTSGHKTVGFNQWDEEWEVGGLNLTTGENQDFTDRIRSKNHIHVFPKTAYYFKAGETGQTAWQLTCFCYDANKNFVGTTFYKRNVFYALPNNTHYIRFMTTSGYGVSYKNDICIHLVWSGTRNGEYEAYTEHTYPLDSTLELRGIPKLDSNNKLYADGDVYAPSGDVTRKYGIVDLGTLTWVLTADSGHNRFHSNSLHALVKFATDNIICSKYPLSSTHSASFVADKVITTSGSTQDNGRLWIWDDDYTSAADFKAAMSGVYLVYELATPTTETADPYQQTQVVNDWGTEEFIDSRDIAIPVGHKTTYLPNLRDKLQHLPSLASDDGYYLISQQNNTMSLELFRIPKAPSEDGTYQLKATVTSGTPTYFWEAIV